MGFIWYGVTLKKMMCICGKHFCYCATFTQHRKAPEDIQGFAYFLPFQTEKRKA